MLFGGLAPAAQAITPEQSAQLAQRGLLKSIVVYNLNNDGPGSLRQALRLANDAGSGVTTHITFARAGTIRMVTSPEIMNVRVIIDGTSAPGYVAGGAPVVGIDFNGKQGLKLFKGSDGSEVLSMSIGNAQGDAISIKGDGVTIAGNYVGIGVDGKSLPNGGDGIHLLPGSDRNRIGTNPEGAAGWVSNVISTNGGNGIVLENSSRNTIVANRIGTDPTGAIAAPNGANGMLLAGPRTRNNTIGGSMFIDAPTGAVNNPLGSMGTKTPTFVTPPLGNLISGNTRSGLMFAKGANRNRVSGNFIGTTASGNAALGNGMQGIWFDDAPRNRVLGSGLYNQPFAFYNVVSGNGAYGIKVNDSDGVSIQGTFVGIGANNATIVGNGADGIWLSGTSRNTIVGGPGSLGNVASGNGHNGIALTGTVSGFRSINNITGLFALGGAAPNQWDGIWVSSSGGDNVIRSTVSSGNVQSGIALLGKATGVTIQSSIMGLNYTGTVAIPNLEDGVTVSGVANRNIIGVTARGSDQGNYLSGNLGNGITLTEKTRRNLVAGNAIGTNKAGANVPNQGTPISNLGQKNKIK